jgi:DNA-binding MarR family transcriptional regulator
MTDINSGSSGSRHEEGAYRSAVRDGMTEGSDADEPLIELVELFYFAYRDFTLEADAVLHGLSFGRAHHRVLHFVNRQPGLRVADLLDILRITKQSLARVLKQLVDEGYIEQMAGMSDRRERRLYVTFKGESLARELIEMQARRFRQAIRHAGPGGEDAVRVFLTAMIGPEPRATVPPAVSEAAAGNSETGAEMTEQQTHVGGPLRSRLPR